MIDMHTAASNSVSTSSGHGRSRRNAVPDIFSGMSEADFENLYDSTEQVALSALISAGSSSSLESLDDETLQSSARLRQRRNAVCYASISEILVENALSLTMDTSPVQHEER